MILLLYSRSSHASEEQSGPGQGHWSYKDWQEWNLHYPDCGGMMQSPININTAKTIFSPQLRPIQLSGYSLPSKERLKLKNNGHTVVLKLPESLAITGGYAQQYRAVQLHLHWGSLTGPGSEHTINNHRFPAEIHVVHYNTKYDNFEEAMVHPDGLAVLGAFLQVGPRENPYYRQILEHLYTIQGEGEEVLVPGFNIAGLLPANLNLYFHYNGSLTTPACYQTVKWTIFNQTVQLSQDQISVLVTTLRGDDDSPLQNNFRRLQELHGRHVLASFQTALTSVKQLPPGSGGSPGRPPLGGAAGAKPSLAPRAGGDSSSEAGAEKHTSSFQAGDVLAVLFGVLFAVTALAFLLYIHKHRNQNARLDSPTKSKVIYTAATTDENAV
ncbi:carbonic anhydrase 9-like isoform X2 [Struthio camelus]|uniref:carbonic anhydrase 9 isoform X2 n=1 Tax=Struthio camelus TaxID=8801 RepID=UPI00051E1F0B|nr:PREDICTED: carbonic anhydrase 9 isoform X1 [Struthio camelus australis]